MIREIAENETALAHPAMAALRPAFAAAAEFVHEVDSVLRPEGYRLVGAFERDGEPAAAVAGFRTGHSLAWRRFLYVDDLSTDPAARRRGHGRALLDWLAAEGLRLGCEQLHLDSAVGLERSDAHRLYLNTGFVISAHHFQRHC
jgi:GNAT superfamily N-acetyltransferase